MCNWNVLPEIIDLFAVKVRLPKAYPCQTLGPLLSFSVDDTLQSLTVSPAGCKRWSKASRHRANRDSCGSGELRGRPTTGPPGCVPELRRPAFADGR